MQNSNKDRQKTLISYLVIKQLENSQNAKLKLKKRQKTMLR
jgi:hypothetical protein